MLGIACAILWNTPAPQFIHDVVLLLVMPDKLPITNPIDPKESAYCWFKSISSFFIGDSNLGNLKPLSLCFSPNWSPGRLMEGNPPFMSPYFPLKTSCSTTILILTFFFSSSLIAAWTVARACIVVSLDSFLLRRDISASYHASVSFKGFSSLSSGSFPPACDALFAVFVIDS